MKPKWHLLFTEVCRTWQRTPTKQQQKCKLIYVCAEFYCEQAVNHEMQLVRQRGLQQRVSWQWRRTGAGAPHKHALLTAGLIPYQSQCVGALLSFWIKSIHPFRTEINFFMCLFFACAKCYLRNYCSKKNEQAKYDKLFGYPADN